MTDTGDKYWECPECGWAIKFKLSYDKTKYVSLCPYCKNELEMDKEEYENDDMEVYFKAEWE